MHRPCLYYSTSRNYKGAFVISKRENIGSRIVVVGFTAAGRVKN